MKKLSVLGILILVAMFSFNVKADIVTLDGANEIANAFFANSASSQKRALKSAAQLEYAWDSNSLTQTGSSMMKSVDEDPTFYVFNNPNGEGFVIVSGDSNARSVIGYSFESSISTSDEIPAPMQEYLLGIDKEIKYIRANVTSSNKNLKATLAGTGGTQKVLLETANWGQNSPFNNLCPVKSGVNCKTGCVPTAFSIVMRYHQWPESGTGTVYNPVTGEAIVLGHTYDWENMPLTYSNSWTEAQKTQVATLMRDVGFALGVTYGTSSTEISDATTTAQFLLVNNGKTSNFNYKSYEGATGDYATSDAINDIEVWKGKIEGSLDNGCPIPYAATNSGTEDSRHMFVLDGYTDNDYYHFNWGWNGSYNGWFQLTAMTPDAGDNYSWGTATGAKHRAYFNIIPNKTVTVSVAVDGEGSVTIDGASVTSKEVEIGTSITLQAKDSNFYGWMVGNDVVSTENPYTFTATENKTYTAKYTTEDNSVTIYHEYLQQEDQDIKTNCSVSGLKVNESAYPLGIDLTLTANCNRGYAFKGWYTLDETFSSTKELSTDNPYTFTTSEETFAIYYSFEKLSTITPNVQSSNSDMGTATWSYNGEQGAVYAGDEITLTATPKSGYMFTGWSNGTTTISNEKTCTVTLEEGVTYTANFALAGADYSVMHSTGTKTNAVGSRCSTWTYNTNATTNPVALQLVSTSGTTEVFGMANSSDKYYASTYDANQTTGYNTVTYTLSVPEGYIITGYNMTYYLSGSSYKGQVTVSNATSTNTPTDQTDQTLFASGLDGQTTSFTLTASQTGQQAITVTSFVVSVLSTGGGSVTPPATQQYTAIVSTNGTGGTATVNGQQSVTVDSGTEVTFVAIPANGYRFTGWSSGTNSVSDQATYTVNISADMNLMANFEAASATQYTATAVASPTEGGTATVAVEGTGTGSSSVKADKGTNVEFTATPATGYEFVNWTGTTISGENPLTLPLNADITLTANFREEQGGGEVEAPEYCTPSGNSNTNNYLTSVTTSGAKENISYSASSHPGSTYKLVDGVIKVNPGTSFTLNLVANSLGAGSSYTVREDIRYCHASLFTDFDINGDFGNAVQTWGNKPPTNNVYGNYDQCMNISATINVPETATIGKSHIRVIYTNAWTDYPTACTKALDKGIAYDFVIEVVAIPTYTVTVTTNGNGGTATASAESVQEGATVTLTATPATGYHFVNWTLNGESVSENATYTTPAINANIEYVANFEKIPTYSVNISVNGNGGTATTSAESVQEGATVTLTATPEEGYRFTGWYKDEELISKSNPYTVTVTENISLTANFEEIPTYTVNVSTNDVNGGTATTSAESVQQGSTVTLTATPEEGYRFTGWYKDEELISKSNPYTVTVTEAIEYVANFVESSDKLLLKFACVSDLHAQQNMITNPNNIYIRESAIKTLEAIKNDKENVDLIVLGGDYTSNSYIPQSSWQVTKDSLINATRRAFNGTKTPVIYVNGNHEYEVAYPNIENVEGTPKEYNAGDYYDVPMKTDIGALGAEDCFYETAINGTGEGFDLLAAYHYVVNGFDFVVLNGGKYLFETSSSYAYSEESVAWVSNKLAQIYASDPNKTVFFLVHIPFSDSKGISNTNKGMDRYSSTTPQFAVNLKNALAQYPNLVMLYGHDHGTDSAYIREATEERVTEYATDGSVYTPGDATYYIQNYDSKAYLGYNSYNLATTDAQSSDVTITSSTLTDGAFVFDLTTTLRNDKGVIRYLHCGSNGRFSGNNANNEASQQIYAFEVADPSAETITATQATSIVAGKTYILVGVKDSNYYALTDELYFPNSSDQRMVGTAVTVDNGTIEYSGDATILWTINKKPSATDKSFFSSFMGSMRYYDNSFEDGQLADRRIIQALMVYVYSDRVELKMKNYGEGNVTSNGITVNQDLTPYVSYRTVTHSDEQKTATPVITSKGGDVAPNTEVTVTVDADEWHNLYYTTDGTEPTEKSTKVDGREFTFTPSTTGKVIVKVAAQEGIRLISASDSVTYTVVDTHGITVSTTVEGVDAQFTINETDKTVTLTVAEIEGYEFVNWTMNGTEVATTREATIRYTQGAQYVANFAKQTFTVTVTANPTNGGTVTEVANPVEYGTTLELTATPAEGYQFVNWTNANGEEVSRDNTYEVTVIENDSLTANFEEFIPQITPVSASTNFGTYSEGNTVYSIDNIKDNSLSTKFWSNGNQEIGKYVMLDLGSYYYISDIELYFAEGDKPDAAAVEISVDNSTWSPVSSFVIGDIVSQKYTCNASKAMARYVRMRITQAKSSWFQMQEFKVYGTWAGRKVTITSNSSELGKASFVYPEPTESGNSIITKENVTVMAVAEPDANCQFVNWTINDVEQGTDPTAFTYTGTEDATIQANFVDLTERFTVTITGGTATVDGEAVTDVKSGTVVTITATVQSGYEFVNWTDASGNEVSKELSFTVEVLQNINYTANFNRVITPEEIYADITKPTVTSGNTSTVLAATVFEYQQAVTLQGDVNFATSQKVVTKPISVVKGTTTFDLDLKIRYNWFGIQLFQIDANNNSEKIYGYYGASSASLSAFVTSLDADVEAGKISYYYETVTEGTENKNNYFVTFPITVPQDLNVGDVFVVRVLTAQNETPVSGSYGQGEYVDFLFVISNQQSVERTVKAKSNDLSMGSVEIISPSQGGTGTGTGGTGTGGQTPTVTTAENVTIQAFIQSDDYRFVNWTIGSKVVGTDDTYTYTGSADVTIQANFEKIPEIYTVSVSSENRVYGIAKKSVSGSTVEEGTSVTFTATAKDGYQFVKWVDEDGTQVSTANPYTTAINANTTLIAKFTESTGLAGKWYRIKDQNSGMYLNAANHTAHTDGPNGGVNVITLNKNSNDQIFKFTASGTNYTLKTRSGYNIVCQQWNVDALTSAATSLTFVDNGNGTYYIMKGATYFKVENVSGTIYPFCDAPSSAKATWVLEQVKISEVNVKKASNNATIKVTTDQAATIKVGGNGYGSTTAENLTATLTLGATAGDVGSEITVESIDGYITSIECVENIELTDVPVTVTEIALRNAKDEAFVVDAPALSKITVVSDAENKVAKVSTTSDLSQGVQVVVEKDIYTPRTVEIGGKQSTPTIFNFLSMPFAFNTADIKYWNTNSDRWEAVTPERQIRILIYQSNVRANGDYKNTWKTLEEEESINVEANKGFVVVGNNDLGETVKLKFESAEEAYNGTVYTVTANSYRNDSGTTIDADMDWNFNGVPYLTSGKFTGRYTLYSYDNENRGWVEHTSAEGLPTLQPYNSVMYQANLGEDLYRDIEITASVANATNDADVVFARAYISIDDTNPAKIILSDESSENFVVNEDAWYMPSLTNTTASAYFNVEGADAKVTVQPAASELPMTVYTGAGTQHRITLTATDGDYDVYLKDAVTGEVVCLNNEEYNFTATAKTTIENRFTVSMVELTGIIEAAKAEGTIKAVVVGDIIKLYGTEEGDEVTLYNTNGMVITNTVAEDGVTSIPTSAEGVMVIRVADQTVKVVK